MRTLPRLTGYAICATPYSGGAELRALLAQSRRAGVPRACFEAGEYARASAAWGTRDFDGYAERLKSEARQHGGVLGFEIHWPDFVTHFSARDPRGVFPDLKLFHVRRQDRLAQALRWALAEQEGSAAPEFDGPRVRALLERILREERAFAALFAEGGIVALQVWRESVLESPRVELRRALQALGIRAEHLDAPELADPDAAHAERLADWRARYESFERAQQVEKQRAGTVAVTRIHAFELAEHNLPVRVPAGWTHGARVTIVNRGNFVWLSRAIGAEGRFERGEVALVVRENGEWTATHKLPRFEVWPGQSVTVHFALVAPSRPGKQLISLDLIDWDVAHFRDRGAAVIEHVLEVEEPSTRRSAVVQRVARRVNPWHFAPSGGLIEGANGDLYPNYIVRARGCKVWDLEGKEYLDYTMANASALLGHAEPRVLAAIQAAMAEMGPLTQLPHPLEAEVSQILCEEFPCAEMVTFGKNGSDVCTVVARLARAFTGKRHILYRGYHGWQDFWAEQPGFADAAIPRRSEPLMHAFRYGDHAGFTQLYERWKDDLAAVMIEPAAWCGDQVGYAIDEPEFLAFIAEAAREAGALLIYDEIITAFRHPGGSVQKATGIVPDLTCVAKALASGMPLAAAVGRADVMRTCMDKIFYPGPTYRGEVYSLAAAKATLQLYRSEPVVAHVNDYGKRLKAGINRLCAALGVDGECVGPDYRLIFVFRDDDLPRFRLQRTLFAQELMRGGIITNIGGMVPSYAHDDAALAQTLSIVGAALETVAKARRRGDLERAIEIPPVYF